MSPFAVVADDVGDITVQMTVFAGDVVNQCL